MPEAIDPVSLRHQYPEGRQLCTEPTVWLFENFASEAEMAAIVAAASALLKRAEVSGAAGGFVSDGRSGSNCWVPHKHDKLTRQLAQRISALVGIALDHAESYQVVHYGPTQEYRAHFDAWDASTERGQRCMARGGQRLVTTLLYLNEVTGGGATAFPKLKIEVAPRKGNLLLFHNCQAGSTLRHELSLHGGLPVTQGEKWAANLWFRERPFR
jgi:prolyl 4-hydroxylase